MSILDNENANGKFALMDIMYTLCVMGLVSEEEASIALDYVYALPELGI